MPVTATTIADIVPSVILLQKLFLFKPGLCAPFYPASGTELKREKDANIEMCS